MDKGGYILTVIDMFSKFAASRIIRDKSSGRVLKALENITKEIGYPKEILSDNGLEFKNKEIKDWCQKNNIEIKHGSPYSPTTTGGIERWNQTLLNKLKKLSNFGELNWKECLEKATIGYNKSYHRAIDCAPLELLGKICEFKIDKEYDIKVEQSKEIFLKRAIKRMNEYQERYKKTDESNVENYDIGEKVWYADTKKESGKLSPTWKTKAIVIGRAVNSYKLRDEEGKEWVSNQRFVKKRKLLNGEECCMTNVIHI